MAAILKALAFLSLAFAAAAATTLQWNCPNGMCADKLGRCGYGFPYCVNERSPRLHIGECTSTSDCPSGMCCSKWGYCGTGSVYCDTGVKLRIGECTSASDCPSGMCCSKWGYCGTGPDYCNQVGAIEKFGMA